MAEIMREEFMYLNDYEIRNKDDWLEEMQSHFDTKENDLRVEMLWLEFLFMLGMAALEKRGTYRDEP